jgi:hypothetical protein
MCLGTTVTCRSCRRDAIIFYPGGRCGEVKPFPSWHRIRGHTRRIRRCLDCIRSHRDALSQTLERENALFRRDYRRMKSLRQYSRGERSHPLPDEEVHLQSNGEFRLQRDDLLPAEDIHLQTDEVFTADRDHPIIISSPSPISAEDQRRMDEFAAYVRADREANLRPAEELTSGQSTTQIDYWGEYQAGRRLHPYDHGSTDGQLELLIFHTEAQLHPQDEILASIEERMEECYQRQADIDATGRAISAEDQGYTYGLIRFAFDNQQAIYHETESVENDLDVAEYEPLPAHEEAADYREHEEPEISFYEWTLRSYEEDPSHNSHCSTESALKEDLDHYEWYLFQYSTELQANDFRRRRAEISNRLYDFGPGNLDGLPFQQWLAAENQLREIHGMNQATCQTEVLEQYWQEVLYYECNEIQEEYFRSRIRYFEDNRREFYGHAHDEHCPMIDRLRSLRKDTEKMMDWADEQHPQLFSVQWKLGQICKISTRCIAIEVEPSDEQWQHMLEVGREAVRQMRETHHAVSQVPTTREVSWNELYSQLSQGWEAQHDTAIGDVDESEAEDEEPPRVRSNFPAQDSRGEFDEVAESDEPGAWLDFNQGEATPQWSSCGELGEYGDEGNEEDL